MEYSAQHFTADVAVADYIAGYCDAPRFAALCRQCGNYGAMWACPPFAHNPLELMQRFRHVRLLASKITPATPSLPLEQAARLLAPERLLLGGELLELEHSLNGHACGFAGACPHCHGAQCQRKAGKPCLHPELVRPALEAYGFDIGLTLERIFGIELLWGRDGVLPPYMVLVSGVFY